MTRKVVSQSTCDRDVVHCGGGGDVDEELRR